MKDLHIDLLTGYVRISGFRLTPDTVLYIKMSKTDSMAPFLVSARINRFRVSGIDFLKAFWDKDIRIRLIMVQAPELEVHLYPPPHELKNSSPGKILLSIPLPKGIRSILLDKLVIRDANLSVVFHSGGKRTCIKVPHAGITATTVQIDEKHKSRTKIFNAEDIQVVLKDLVLETPDHMNALQFGTIRVSTGSSVAGIENLHLLPSFSRYEYSRKKGHQADRTDIQVRTIEMHQVELRKLIVEHKVIIGTIMVDGLIVDDFLDRRVAEISGYFPPMPQQALLKSGQ
jgi:hypothetical protein